MEILYDKVVRFKNHINANEWIDLIEKVSLDSYPLESVERRPHLTMLLPINFSPKDSINAIKLRNMFYSIALDQFAEYMEHYNNFGITLKKDFISVSKLLSGNEMPYHNDSNDPKHIIGMLYLNNNFNGGELSFRDIGLKYKPEVGDFVIYPGSLSHSVQYMSGNPRYNIGMGLIDPEYFGKEVIQV